MILSDDHASHAISAYGSAVNVTPRIDEIAANGCLLTNCFATNALCSPSRASILTGTYSHVNGVRTLVSPIDASQPTFVSELRAAGYRTAIVGKWHMGDGEGHNPQGFDYWDVLIDQGEYYDPQLLSEDGLRTVDGYTTDILTDLALNWVEGLDGENPWCLLLFHKAPHRPWQPDAAHTPSEFAPIAVPRTFNDDYATRTSSARRAALRIAEHLNVEDLKVLPPDGLDYDQLALWKYQRFMEDYLACVASVDDSVGRVIDWLRARGEFENTMVIYSSDQGFFLGDHGWFDKRLMYEQALRMPFVVSYPHRFASGKTFEGIVTNVDFAQTILDAAGVRHHPRMQGRSFFGELAGGEAVERPGMYYRYWEHGDSFHNAPAHYGYRSRRYKIIYFYNDGLGVENTGMFTYPPEWELYDLDQDPDELHNVYNDPGYRSVRAEMQRLLWQSLHEVGDVPHSLHPVPVDA